ncbi:MAG: NAD(+)/NADH kinase, partial [Pseudonocardiaceae bacterium]
MTRRALLLAHTGRHGAIDYARRAYAELVAANFAVDVLESEASELDLPNARPVSSAAAGTEIVVALGGDGTVLRGAEAARLGHVPLLGVNLGRMGFLTSAEAEDLDEVLARIVNRDYHTTQRMTVDVIISRAGGESAESNTQWALNEASLERAPGSPMMEVLLAVDGQPVSRWGCDGVVCS